MAGQLKQLGFEPGWGKNVGIVRKRLHELLDILEVNHAVSCRLDRASYHIGSNASTCSRLMQSAYALQAPDDDTLASFLGALPMMFSIAILSPHGFFGQSGGSPFI